jgi:hypothetical protein
MELLEKKEKSNVAVSNRQDKEERKKGQRENETEQQTQQ